MEDVQRLLGFSLFALLILHVHGFPAKGPKSQSSNDPKAGGGFAPRWEAATGHHAPMYSTYEDLPKPGQMYKPVPRPSASVQSAPSPGMSLAVPQAGYPAEFSAGTGFVPAPAGFPTGFVPAPAGFPAGVGRFVPVLGGSDAGSTQTEGYQYNQPESEWMIEPKIFSEEELANTQSLSPSSAFPPPPPPPPGPVLQSGETSNIVKEADIGRFKHETEEFGYPAAASNSRPGFPSNPMPYIGVGGFGGQLNPYKMLSPYPNVDYRLLYGMYPPGTYTTFSKSHERGKDYNQDIHYLKEHGSDSPNAPDTPVYGQQKKTFKRVL